MAPKLKNNAEKRKKKRAMAADEGDFDVDEGLPAKKAARDDSEDSSCEDNTPPQPPPPFMDESTLYCGICLDIMHNAMNVCPCNHKFCAACIYEWHHNNPTCPQCRWHMQDITRDATFNVIIDKYLETYPDKKRSEEQLNALDERELHHLESWHEGERPQHLQDLVPPNARRLPRPRMIDPRGEEGLRVLSSRIVQVGGNRTIAGGRGGGNQQPRRVQVAYVTSRRDGSAPLRMVIRDLSANNQREVRGDGNDADPPEGDFHYDDSDSDDDFDHNQRHAEEQTRNNTELARINRLRAEKEARERARKEAEKRARQEARRERRAARQAAEAAEARSPTPQARPRSATGGGRRNRNNSNNNQHAVAVDDGDEDAPGPSRMPEGRPQPTERRLSLRPRIRITYGR